MRRVARRHRHPLICPKELSHPADVDNQVRAHVESTIEKSYDAMDVPDAAPIVQLVLRAAAALGHTVESAPMGGGCDANVLNGRGFQVANLGTGMRDIHTVKEWLRVSDMQRTAEVIVEMLRLHASG